MHRGLIVTYALGSPQKSTFDLSPFASSIAKRHTQSPSVAQNSQPIYIVVFGYPPDKYSVTVEYFKSLGDSTEPDPNVELVNCFRIGYRDPSDALRAARKNGEILGGSWMVGTKWAVSHCISKSRPLANMPFLRTPIKQKLSWGNL